LAGVESIRIKVKTKNCTSTQHNTTLKKTMIIKSTFFHYAPFKSQNLTYLIKVNRREKHLIKNYLRIFLILMILGCFIKSCIRY
jgi:accessory gene regulator protein AgrB